MIRAGSGKSASRHTLRAAEEACNEAMTRADIDRADWLVVFFTAEHLQEKERLVATLKAFSGTDQIIGSSGAGVLTGRGEIEGGPGLAVLAVRSDQIAARLFLLEPLRGRDDPIGAEVGRMRAPIAGRTSLSLLFPDSYNGQPHRLLQAAARERGYFPVIGAGSSENGTLGATYQLSGRRICSNAVCGLHLCGSFDSMVDITQGCQPITNPMTITKARQNLIIEIDHRPAFEVFTQVLKGPLLDDLHRALTCVFVGLAASREADAMGRGQYLVRNVVGLEPEKGIVGVADAVREGDTMIFTLRDGPRAREDLGQMLQRQAARLSGKQPAFGFYFNCCARGAALYGLPGIDTAYIQRHLGEFPLIGMFGGYELAPLGGANHLFAYTGVLALVTEEGQHQPN